MIRFASFLVLLLSMPTAARADDDIPGVVLAVNGVQVTGLADAARGAGGADWRVEVLEAAPMEGRPAPLALLTATERLYDEGDFPRCLTRLTDPSLDVARLLADDHPREAARLLIVSAACIAGAGDTDRARSLFRRAFLRELDIEAGLADLRPDIVELAESAREEVQALRRVRLSVDAPNANLSVDGRPVRCDRAPCVVRLYPGSHVLVLTRLGRARRVEQLELEGDLSIRPRLDLATPEVARSQLAAALSDSENVESNDFARAVADAYGARVVVVVQEREERTRASIYDRGRGSTLARQGVDTDPEAAPLVVRNVINEWRGEVETGTEWWVWTIVAASVAVAGVAAFLLVLPEVTSYSYVFTFE